MENPGVRKMTGRKKVNDYGGLETPSYRPSGIPYKLSWEKGPFPEPSLNTKLHFLKFLKLTVFLIILNYYNSH